MKRVQLKRRLAARGCEFLTPSQKPASSTFHLRVGQGYDIHAVVAGRPLILGGVHVPHEHGLLGHSDADVLLHAVIDALLGAAALGDIGQHFPDTDPRFAGANSRMLLRKAVDFVHGAGYAVINVDSTIIAEAPKLAPYLSRMAENIAEDLHISSNRVNIKAKTNEAMDSVGKKEAISAHVVLLLESKSHSE